MQGPRAAMRQWWWWWDVAIIMIVSSGLIYDGINASTRTDLVPHHQIESKTKSKSMASSLSALNWKLSASCQKQLLIMSASQVSNASMAFLGSPWATVMTLAHQCTCPYLHSLPYDHKMSRGRMRSSCRCLEGS